MGRSLFGLEKWGDPPQVERLHGYSIGSLDFGETRRARLWPRRAHQRHHTGPFELDRDLDWKLDDEGGTAEATDFGPSPRVCAGETGAGQVAVIPSGWQHVDLLYLGSLPELSDSELVRYFDGQVPTWRHGVSDRIPRRGTVEAVVSAIRKTADSRALSFHLLLGAGGEGKSTGLLQVAADVAGLDGWQVLWRPESGVGLDPQEVLELPQDGESWLLVTDDGEELVRPMLSALRKAHEVGRKDIHFLVASRDTDWAASGGSAQPWRNYASAYDGPVRFKGVTREDARLLVTAWEFLGKEGLRELSNASDTEARIDLLVQAVRSESSDEGSFFGGLLEARLGPDGLREHLVTLLARLGSLTISGSRLTLADALMYVACCHGASMGGLDEGVLAELVGVDRQLVHRDVVRPMGDEAAAVRSAGHVYTRHRKVADALLIVGDQRCGYDLPELWRNIAGTVVRMGKDGRVSKQCHGSVAHAGPRLLTQLPAGLKKGADDSLRFEIARAAAQASISTERTRLSYVVDLGKVYRVAGKLNQAVQTFREHADDLMGMSDYASVVRGYLYEWGVCEGEAGWYAMDAWLAALSIADQVEDVPVKTEQAIISLAGLGVAFDELAGSDSQGHYSKARAACAFLGLGTKSDPRGYFRKYQRETRRAGTPQPTSLQEAIAWLARGVVAVRKSFIERDIPDFVACEQATFEQLARLLA